MATEQDLQRLVVQLEASFTKYDRAWAKAMGETDTNVRRVQQRFDGMSKVITNAGSTAGRGLEPVKLQTSNIAAQFQDIAVQLSQPGTSPFLIAMQQGTQLSAILNQSKSPIAALSAGFLQMINPVSLATIGIIALGGAAVQYLTTLLGDGKSATDVIKEQNDVIRRVAENWGDAVPALKSYVDQLDRASQQKDTSQAFDAVVAKQFEALRGQLGDIRAEFAKARTDLAAVGASAQEIDALQAEFNSLSDKVKDGTATTADLERMMALLAQTTGASTVPSLSDFQNVLAGVASALAEAARQAAVFRQEQAALANADAQVDAFNANTKFVDEQKRLNGLTREQLQLETEVARVKEEAKRDDTLISDQQALDIARGRLQAEERRSQIASSAKAGARTEDRERQAVLDLIEALEHEQSLLGMTEQQKAVANALRQAGAAATDQQRQAIMNLVNATYDERTALEAASDHMREFQGIAKSALQGFLTDIAAGKDGTEALSNALANFGNRLISLGLESLFSGGASGSGLLGGIFGGARANGGPVQTGKSYLVGERGPEIFTPKISGMITANDRIASSGNGNFTYAPTIDARGADIAAVARLEQMQHRQAAEFEGRVKQIVRGKGSKWR